MSRDKSTIGEDLGEQRKKTGRIGPNPGSGGMARLEELRALNRDEESEEDISVEPSCPLGFIHQNTSVTEICSDVDEEAFIFSSSHRLITHEL